MKALTLFVLSAALAAGPSAGAVDSRHVVLVVWDGMRPDFISETNTPMLHALRQHGVFFQNNHSVYLSSTEVNGTALATGDYPQNSGVIANREYRPEINASEAVATESLDAMRAAEKHGNYLEAKTIAEILQAAGRRTIIAGTKPVVLLHDHAKREESAESVVLYEGKSLPQALVQSLTNKLGAFPRPDPAKTNGDIWTTHALVGSLWEKDVPAFSLLWLGEPDNSQHGAGPGSARALAAIRNSDRALGLAIDALKQKGVYDQTDVLVVSDHGFSTISGSINVAARLQTNGFKATRQFGTKPATGDILVNGLGGSVLFYVTDHDRPTIERLVSFLQKEEYVGVIFSRPKLTGTFALEDGMIASSHAPDVAISMRWNKNLNADGIPGTLISDSEAPGAAGTVVAARNNAQRGTHVSLSHFDLHNTLVAAGPDFKQGFVDQLASGNVDVAPTILHILGVQPPKSMNGRVLVEALSSLDNKLPAATAHKLEAEADTPNGKWKQLLLISEVNGVRYLDEGNGGLTPALQKQDPP